MDGRKALAKAFGEYVDGRGLTQTDVAAMGGPSTTSQTKIRTTDEPLSRQTLQKIEHVMGWEPGRASRILKGRMTPEQQQTITSYSDDELLAEVRRRMTREGGSDAQQQPGEKSAGGLGAAIDDDPAEDVTRPIVDVDPDQWVYESTRAVDPSESRPREQ